MPLYDVTPMASTWCGSSGGTVYVSSSLVPAIYICFCAGQWSAVTWELAELAERCAAQCSMS